MRLMIPVNVLIQAFIFHRFVNNEIRLAKIPFEIDFELDHFTCWRIRTECEWTVKLIYLELFHLTD